MVMKQSVAVMVEQVSHAGLRDYSMVEVVRSQSLRAAGSLLHQSFTELPQAEGTGRVLSLR